MSDVSGIPNMGFGGGNFFAPQFSYNPQMSAGQASAAYMPAENYAQNVTNNLFSSGGGFGRQTDYYSQLGAQYSAAGMSPYGIFSEGGGGGGSASPYQTSPSVFDTGASPFQGGGGSSGLGGSIYGGGFGGGSSTPSMSDFQSPANNYNAFQGGWGGVSNNLNLGAGGTPEWSTLFPGGGSGSSSGTSPIDWSHLFGGGGGAGSSAPYTSGIEPDLTGGRTFADGAAPAATPQQQQQQPGINWGNVGAAAGAGSTMPYTSGIEPDMTGGRTLTGDTTPTATPQQQTTEPSAPDGTRTYDFKPMFEGGGGGGFGSGGTESQSFGGNAGSFGGNIFDYTTGGAPAAPTVAQDTSGQGSSAAKLAEQARARLADIIGSPETEKAVEKADAAEGTKEASAAEDAAFPNGVPLPRERPAGADAARPPADVPPQDLGYLQGKGPGDLKGVNARFVKAMQEFAREYNGSQGDYSMSLRSGLRGGDQGFHGKGEAMDINLIDRKNGERLTDYQTRDPVVFRAYQDNANQFHDFLEKNYPDLAAQHRWGGYFWNGGPGQYGSQDIMHHDLGGNRIGMGAGSWNAGLGQQSADAYGLPTGGGIKTPPPQFTFDWSNAPIQDASLIQQTYKSPSGNSLYQLSPDGTRIPVPMGKGMNETTEYDPFRGTSTFAAPVEQGAGVNQGQPIARPPEDIPDPQVSSGGFNALDAAAPNISASGFNAIDAAAKHSGLELARANIDTPIEKIAMERGGQKAVDQVSSMAVGMTPRQLLQSYGGLFMSKAEPLFQSLGITRQDFDKAIAMPPTQQDIKMRVAEGFPGSGASEDDSWTPQEYTPKWNTDVYQPALGGGVQHRDETASDIRWSDFAQPGNVIDRTSEQLSRAQLAALKAGGTNYPAGPEVASSPLGAALGLGDLPMPQGMTATAAARPQRAGEFGGDEPATFNERISPFDDTTGMRDFQSPANDYSAFQQPASRDALAKTMNFSGFSPSPEPRQGGVGPEVTLSPEHMQTMAEVESHDNPALHDKGSQYKGLYQLNNAEFRKYGGTGDIYDYEENAKAAGAKMVAEGQRAQDILGHELSPVEQYMVHQQGLAGTLAHLANPDELAWKNFQSASGWSDAKAKTAIWGNLSDDMKAQFGNDVNNITSRDFINLWNDQYASKAVAAGLPRPGPGGYFNASP